MTVEQAMQRLKEHKILFTSDHGCDETTIQALDKAMASLEAWNKIKEQIEEEKSYAHADYNGYKNDVLKFDPYYIDGDYPLPKNYFGEGMERAEDIINKHLSEDIRYEEST